MVSGTDRERETPKARGRPFAKGNTKGRPRSADLGIQGREKHSNGSNVGKEQKSNGAPVMGVAERPRENDLNKETNGLILIAGNAAIAEVPSPNAIIQESAEDKEQVIDTLEFTRGESKLKIVLSLKSKGRLMQTKIFLNDEIEVRPMTYPSKKLGALYMDMLRQHMKKR